VTPTPDPRAIRELAYRIWEERGCPEGSADSIWLEAERQLSQVHEQFTRAEARSLNASSASAQAPAPMSDAEYSPDHPPVNAEFKWAASELKRSAPAAGAGQKSPAPRRQTRR